MTERLSTLLHRQADLLDVPPPSAASVLRRGRAVRRRRRAAGSLGALAVLGAIAGAGLVATRGDDTPRVGPAGPAVVGTGATFALGTALWYDDATRRVTVDDAAVKSLHYTSAGVLIRHGDNDSSDGGGPQRFSLLTPSGDVRPLSLVTEEVAHTTDPARPYVAWGQVVDGAVEVVVHDVGTDQEVARVPVPGVTGDHVTTALDGDRIYARVADSVSVVDWRTGEVTPFDRDITEVGNGRGVADGSVVDLASGAEIWRSETDDAEIDLSPDGRFALVTIWGNPGADGIETPTNTVVDLDAGGAPVPLDAGGSPLEWTAGSALYAVSADTLTLCEPASGACTESDLDLGVSQQELEQTIRYGGAVYES